MKIISHRGNLRGPNPIFENSPEYIKQSLKEGFDTEVDLWYIGDSLYLGHDFPCYKINLEFLENDDRLWVHCKNIRAVEFLSQTSINYFWHDMDKMTLTSKKIPWSNCGFPVKDGIMVSVKSRSLIALSDGLLGICTDYPIDCSL